MGYKHKFTYQNHESYKFKFWRCEKCERVAYVNGMNLKQVKRIYLSQDTYSDRGDFSKFKMHCRSSYKLIKVHDYPGRYTSGAVGIIKNQRYYLVNPFNGKILTKIDCEYNDTEMLMKEIL